MPQFRSFHDITIQPITSIVWALSEASPKKQTAIKKVRSCDDENSPSGKRNAPVSGMVHHGTTVDGTSIWLQHLYRMHETTICISTPGSLTQPLKNGWLEDYCPFGMVTFRGYLRLRGCSKKLHTSTDAFCKRISAIIMIIGS